MSETAQLSLPLLAPSQAQKHVTVNEALARIDGLTHLEIASRNVVAPPAEVADGSVYAVPHSAGDAWAEKDGKIAVKVNGGWVFVTPKCGWRAFIADEGTLAVHDGAAWVGGLLSLSPASAGADMAVREIDHILVAGGAHETGPVIPANAMVLGVTGRVVSTIGGSLSSWRLGAGGDDGRFGRGLGLAEGSWVRGVLASPATEYAPTALTVTPENGEFSEGTVRLAIHYLTFRLPEA